MKTLLGAAVLCAAVTTASLAWAHADAQAPVPPAPGVSPFPFDQHASALGVSVRDATADDIAKAKLTQPGGVVVQRVMPGSAAEHAGLKEGDVIVDFDGERVRSARQFTRLVQDTPAGRTVKAAVVRDGARRTLDVTPEAPRRARIEIPDISGEVQQKLDDLQWQLPEIAPESSRRRLGTMLLPLTDQLAEHLGVRRGVLVSSVDVNSPAARAGLKAGDVITAINGHEVSTPGDVRAELRAAGEGSKIDLRVTRDRKELTLSATN